jgi:hypothetical protein
MPALRWRSRARSTPVAPAPTGVIDLRNLAPEPADASVKRSTGWLSGGGAIQSPAGAWSRAPGAAGVASFGIAVRHLDEADAPTGFAALTFESGNLDLRSTGFDWLLFVGRIGVAAGWGTLNGVEGYSFKVMAVDGGPAGGGALRVRIWLSATAAVIYDSDPAVRGDVPSSAIVRGSVTVLPQ